MFSRKIFIMLLLWATQSFADGFTASVGVDYSTGKYGSSSSTDVYYVPLNASYNAGRLTYKMTVPWISVTGDGSIVPGGFAGSGSGASGTIGTFGCAADSRKGASKPEDNGPCAGTTTTTTTTGTTKRTTQSGLGDIIAAAVFNVLDNPDGFVVDLTGKVKLPTASESKGLGSGKTDYAVQTNVDYHFGAPYASFGLGYRWLGEPSGVDYKNVIYGSFGGGYTLSDKAEIGLSYDWATAAVSGSSKPQEVSVFGSYRLSNSYKLSAVLYGGLSNASPDVGGGLTLNYYF